MNIHGFYITVPDGGYGPNMEHEEGDGESV